jgi:hypothetical protein
MIAPLKEGVGGEAAAAAAAAEETLEGVIVEDRHRNLQTCHAVDQLHLAMVSIEDIEKIETVAGMAAEAEVVVAEDEAGVPTSEKTIITREVKNDGVNLENSTMKKSSYLIKNLNLILDFLVLLLPKQTPSSKFLFIFYYYFSDNP